MFFSKRNKCECVIINLQVLSKLAEHSLHKKINITPTRMLSEYKWGLYDPVNRKPCQTQHPKNEASLHYRLDPELGASLPQARGPLRIYTS